MEEKTEIGGELQMRVGRNSLLLIPLQVESPNSLSDLLHIIDGSFVASIKPYRIYTQRIQNQCEEYHRKTIHHDLLSQAAFVFYAQSLLESI